MKYLVLISILAIFSFIVCGAVQSGSAHVTKDFIKSETPAPVSNKPSALSDDFKTSPPIYCSAVSTPEQITLYETRRKIEPLGAESIKIKGLKLEQVQVMIRHGARTLADPFKCWSGYDPTWNCQSGEVVSGWVHEHGTHEEHPANELKLFKFPKHYDARVDLNLLTDGKCELGQLIPEGHRQHDINGKLLAQAYFPKDANPMSLFDMKKVLGNTTAVNEKFYFRSTEYQRTRMSGAQLISSMIKTVDPAAADPEIQLHMMDKKKELMYPMEESCYDLVDALQKAYKASGYVTDIAEKQKTALELSEKMFGIATDARGGADAYWPWLPLDCLYTAACLNQNFPEGEIWTRPNVERVMAAVQDTYEWIFRANDALYSKIGYARMVMDMKAYVIKLFCQGEADTAKCSQQFFQGGASNLAHAKYVNSQSHIFTRPFILFSGHDNTIGPFMATFGEEFWKSASIQYFAHNGDFAGLKSPFASFASLLSLEFYRATDTPLFRFVYNGVVLTQFVPGCAKDQELCPIKTLFTALDWASPEFAVNPCPMQKPESEGETTSAARSAMIQSMIAVIVVLGLVRA